MGSLCFFMKKVLCGSQNGCQNFWKIEFDDDKGKFKAHPNLLKSQIFPYDIKIKLDKIKKEMEKGKEPA